MEKLKSMVDIEKQIAYGRSSAEEVRREIQVAGIH